MGSPPASIERRLASASCCACCCCCFSSGEGRFQRGIFCTTSLQIGSRKVVTRLLPMQLIEHRKGLERLIIESVQGLHEIVRYAPPPEPILRRVLQSIVLPGSLRFL